MHILTKHIVYATDEQNAKDLAKMNAEQLCDGSSSFDWFNADPDRYAESGTVLDVTTEEGRGSIEESWNYYIENFTSSFEKVAEFIRNGGTVAELLENGKGDTLRYYMSCLGQYSGGDTYIYGADADGIRTRKELDGYLSGEYMSEEDKEENCKVYVVAIDMHF